MASVKIGEAFISVTAETERADADIRRLQAETNGRRARIEVEADNVERVDEEINHAARDRTSNVKVDTGGGSDFEGMFSGLGEGMAGLIKIPALIGAVGVASLAAAGNALTLTSSLLPLAGLAVALPGVLAGAAVGGIALVAALKDAPTVLAGVGQQMGELQQTISKSFWNEAAQPIRDLTTSLLPSLKSGLGQVGSDLGATFSIAANTLKSSLGGGVLDGMLANLSTAIQVGSQAIQPLIQAFITLGGVGSKFLPELAAGFANIAAKFGDFIQKASASGQLQSWFEGGISVLKTLGSVVGSVTSIFGGLFKAADAAGGTTIQMLASGLSKVAAVVNSPAFQSGMTTVFASASTAVEGLLKAVTSPAFMTGLMDLLKGFMAGVAGILPVLPQLSSLIGMVASAFGRIFAAVGPLIGQLLAALIPALMQIIPAVMSLLPAIVSLAQGFMPLITAVLPIVVQLINALIPVVLALIPPILSILTAVAPVVAMLGDLLIPVIQMLLPIVTLIFNAIAQIITAAMQIIQGIIQVVTGIITGNWSMVWEGLQNIVSGAMNTINAIISGLMSVIGSVISAGWNMVVNLFSSAWSSISSAVSDGINGVVGFVSGLPGQLMGALGDLGGMFVNAGASLIQGLADGISGAVGAATSAIGGVMDAVANFLPHSPAKQGAFSGKGWTPFSGAATIDGFAEGMLSRGDNLKDATASLMGMASDSLSLDANFGSAGGPRIGGGSVGSLGSSTTHNVTQHIAVSIDASTVKDFNSVVEVFNNIGQTARTGRGTVQARIA